MQQSVTVYPSAHWQQAPAPAAVEQQIDTLVGASLGVSGVDLRCQAMEAIMALREEPAALALVKRDITPENLLAHEERWVGLVDPVPLQDSGTYYAALFPHCYRVYLPAMGHAPRYAQHCFHEQTATLAAIADGYERGYAQADSVMRRRLHLAEWLWTLQCVAKSSTLLQGGLNAEMRLRRDDGANVAVTLEMSLRALAQLRW